MSVQDADLINDSAKTGFQAYRIEQVCSKLQISRAYVYILVKNNTLPPPIKLGKVSVWLESDLNHAIDKLVQNRNQKAGL